MRHRKKYRYIYRWLTLHECKIISSISKKLYCDARPDVQCSYLHAHDTSEGMSVIRVQASAFDVGSDVTMLRYSFFEILEIILHSCNINHLYTYTLYFFTGPLNFLLAFQLYHRIVKTLSFPTSCSHQVTRVFFISGN